MGGLFKGIKKAVKGVVKGVTSVVKGAVKAVKKVVGSPIGAVLVAGALVFATGGLGGLFAQGGVGGLWGGIKTGLAAFAQRYPLLGAMVSKGMSWAGYGAVSGGVAGLLTGQDPLRSAFTGALTGAVAGAAAGGLGHAMGGAAQSATLAQHGMGAVPSGAPGVAGTPPAGAASGAAGGGAAGGLQGGGQGFLGMTMKDWMSSPVVGGVVQGVGQGLSGYAQARSAERIRREADERRAGSYEGVRIRAPHGGASLSDWWDLYRRAPPEDLEAFRHGEPEPAR